MAHSYTPEFVAKAHPDVKRRVLARMFDLRALAARDTDKQHVPFKAYEMPADELRSEGVSDLAIKKIAMIGMYVRRYPGLCAEGL